MIKKIFIISSILLFLVTIFFGVYNFAFRDIEQIKLLNSDKKEESNDDNKSTKIDTQNIKAITTSSIVFPALDRDGKKIRFYDKDNGSIKEVAFDGSTEKMVLENDLNNFIDVRWSPNKSFIISSFKENDEINSYLYSFITMKKVELKKGMDSVIWDSQGDKIIYKYFNSEDKERSLNVADPNGKNWKKLVSLSEEFKKISLVQVPQTLFVSFWNYPDAFQETTLSKINIIDGENIENILKGKFGANYLWSPDGRNFLVSSVNEGGSDLKLELSSADGSSFRDLNIPTLTDKCVWAKDGNSVFCALPANLSKESIIPNEYQERKILTKDTFWEIDVESGRKERIVELQDFSEDYDASNLFLSPKEDMLFFVNRHNDKLYRIIL